MKRGSEVYTVATDMSKAFDLALHSKMFEKMFEAKLSPIFVRLLIFIYRSQEANILWDSTEKSKNFKIRNGTGQGRVLAAIAYCMYVCSWAFHCAGTKWLRMLDRGRLQGNVGLF